MPFTSYLGITFAVLITLYLSHKLLQAYLAKAYAKLIAERDALRQAAQDAYNKL